MFMYFHERSKCFFISAHNDNRSVLLGIARRPTKGSSKLRLKLYDYLVKHNVPPVNVSLQGASGRVVMTKAIVDEWMKEWKVDEITITELGASQFAALRISQGWRCLNMKMLDIDLAHLYEKYHEKPPLVVNDGNPSADSVSA